MTRFTVGFDDVDTSSQGYALIADGYHGLDWHNFGASDPSSPAFGGELDGSGYPAGITSGDQVGFSYYARQASVSIAGGSFTLKRVELTAGWDTKLNVEIVGYRNGERVYDKQVELTDRAPTLVKLHFKGVDDVEFKPLAATADPNLEGQGKHIVFDDMKFGRIRSADAAADQLPGAKLAAAFGADHHNPMIGVAGAEHLGAHAWLHPIA